MPEQPSDLVPADAIDQVPAEPDPDQQGQLAKLQKEFGDLQIQYEAARSEIASLKGSTDVARAKLIEPYAWAVFGFLCAYCAAAFGLLIAQGAAAPGFHLNDGVLGVLVGSTAVAAIGLVQTIVKGLFPVAAGLDKR